MYTTEALLDLHERAHGSSHKLLTHCRSLTAEELDRELPGFGYPTVQLQLHHQIDAEKYWVGVLEGRIDVDDNPADYPTIDSLDAYRKKVVAATANYLRTALVEELNTARPMMTWGNKEQLLTPAHVLVRTVTHLYHHQGQILAMCRLHGKPASGMDFPLL